MVLASYSEALNLPLSSLYHEIPVEVISLISVEQINGLSIVVTFRVFSWRDLELSN